MEIYVANYHGILALVTIVDFPNCDEYNDCIVNWTFWVETYADVAYLESGRHHLPRCRTEHRLRQKKILYFYLLNNLCMLWLQHPRHFLTLVNDLVESVNWEKKTNYQARILISTNLDCKTNNTWLKMFLGPHWSELWDTWPVCVDRMDWNPKGTEFCSKVYQLLNISR